jgi:acyl carrier protein
MMWLKNPRLTGKFGDSSISLLRESLAEYGVSIDEMEGARNLNSLKMDDIDFVEAVQLVSKFTGAKIDVRNVGPTTTINEVVALIDTARGGSS